MTLSTDTDPGGYVFVLTICDKCGADSYTDQDKLEAEGWSWTIYADNEGPHYCPDCGRKGAWKEEEA